MKSLAVACILAIALISTGDGMWCDEDLFQLRPHQGAITGCTGKGMKLSAQMHSVKCEPRATLVPLTPPSSYAFFPNYALVNRCGGFCPSSKSCMASNITIKEVPVRMHGFYSKDCFNVFVEEHEKCRCQCSVKARHCKAHQKYSPSNCACECMTKEKCDETRQMVWNEKLCKCMCTKPEEMCATGLEWVPSLCRCARVMDLADDITKNYIRRK